MATRYEMPDWITGMLPVLVGAIVGALGAYIGAYTGASTQENIWKRDRLYQQTSRIIEKRVEVLRAMTVAITDAQRARFYDSWIDARQLKFLLKIKNCTTAVGAAMEGLGVSIGRCK